MLLACSNDLQKAMHVQLEPASESDSDTLHCWYAHTFRIGRRNCVVVMHTDTWFSLVLWGMKAKDFAALPEKLPMYIRQLLESYYISEEIIAAFLADSGTVTLVKSKGRMNSSHMSRLSMDLKYGCDPEIDMDPEELLQLYCSQRLNLSIHGKDYNLGGRRFFQLLQQQYDYPFYNLQMYHLKITLDFPDFEISRVLRVPEFTTFRQLHLMVQKSFNWQDYHYYEFIVKNASGKTAILIQPDAQEDWERSVPVVCDTDYTVGEVFAQTKEVQYVYDMGDDWHHRIQLLEVTHETSDVAPTCLEVTGKAPPEDCGGIDGYRQLLAGDSEKLDWVESTYWEEQTPEEINPWLINPWHINPWIINSWL